MLFYLLGFVAANNGRYTLTVNDKAITNTQFLILTL